MKSCIFSNRIYKNLLDNFTIETIQNTNFDFNKAIRTAYNMIVNQELYNIEYEKSLHLILKENFNINDYYANSILRETAGIFKSNKETWKINIKKLEAEIETRERKIKVTETSLKNKNKVLESVIDISKAIKNNKKIPQFKTYKGAKENLIDKENFIFQVKYKNRIKLYNIYEFEVCYLKPEIKRLKNRLRQLNFGLGRTKNKLEKLKLKPNLTCFGSKDFFKKQFTVKEYIDNHDKWYQEFTSRRNKSFIISGRKDATQGNFVFRYNNKKLSFTSMDGKNIEIDNIYFPYGQDKLEYALTQIGENRKPISWEVEDHVEYYIIKATVELPKKEYINYSRNNGIVSIDINYDHIDITNINNIGNIIGQRKLEFNLEGKSSNQVRNILGNLIKQLMFICKEEHKPLGMEDLNAEDSKLKLLYGNAKRNHKLSGFAYSLITTLIESRAYKDDIRVFKRNPAFTSQIGKVKYMKNKGLSIHQAASYVIGRRCMNFKDKLPKEYKKLIPTSILPKHHWSHWRNLSKDLKAIQPKYFYRNINIDNISSFKELSKAINC